MDKIVADPSAKKPESILDRLESLAVGGDASLRRRLKKAMLDKLDDDFRPHLPRLRPKIPR
ncbi:MAG: hypothetical protein JSS65_02435 [Armatimonadetes bacterium]|nr:hypothetical protein [Armatimonadota bacterium]